MTLSQIRFVFCLVLISLAGWTLVSAQQSALTVRLDDQQVTDAADALQVNVFFHLVDDQGRVVSGLRLDNVIFEADDGKSVSVPVSDNQQTTTGYIALVLDASGSMAAANPAMRDAAKAAVKSVKSSTAFSVWSFSDTVSQVQTFTPDSGTVESAIDSIRSTPNGATCLYDAAYQAVNDVSHQPQGRRAVILFTDGVDERDNGQPCSIHPLSDVVDLAQTNRVPIYTVGLIGTSGANGTTQVSAGELSQMSLQTNGMSSTGSENELNDMFQAMIQAINSQWQAQVALYPSAGSHQITMTPVLNGGLRLVSQTFTIMSGKNYIKPFQPSIDNLVYDQTLNQYTLTMSAQGAPRVSKTVITVHDHDGGTDQQTISRDGFPTNVTIDGSSSHRARIMT